MDFSNDSASGAHWFHYVIYLAGVVGLTFAITSVWLGMRSVMDIGGYCASGGPYQISVQCPDGVSLVMVLAFPLGFLAGGLMVWTGQRLGGIYADLVGLAWPAGFLGLGFNFLQYGINPPDGSGDAVWGWLIPGVIFVLLGGFPLIGWIATQSHTTILPGMPPRPTPRSMDELRGMMRDAARLRASGGDRTLPLAFRPIKSSGTAEGMVSQLERLAKLHESGSLTDVEYEQAKRALLLNAASGG
jgi:hypothetical protein